MDKTAMDGGSAPTAYGAAALTVTKISALQAVMNKLVEIARSEESLIGPITAWATGWTNAGKAVDTASDAFRTANDPLVASWHSRADSTIYKEAVEVSKADLDVAANNMLGSSGGPGGPSQGGAGVADSLTTLAEQITAVSAAVVKAQQELNAAADKFQTYASRVTGIVTDEQELEFVNQWRGHVLNAGAQLTTLGSSYATAGATVTQVASSLKWRGPGSGNGVTPGSPGSPASSPGGAPTDAAPGEQPGGEQPGGEQPGGEQPGAGGANPEIPAPPPTGPGLAGMPAPVIPKAPVMPPVTVPDLPGAHPAVPIGGMPIGAVPGRGGVGGPRIPGGPGGPGGPNIPVAPGGVGDKQIPRAAQPVTAPQALSGGQRPGAAGASFAPGGTGTSAPAGGGGMPPMMPPGGVGAGGGGRRKGGGGPIRPVGRKRDRRKEETPGVPVGLRGKAGKDLPGAFPPIPTTTRRRQQEAPPSETLQLLDEDLWKVEETETATPPVPRRLAN